MGKYDELSREQLLSTLERRDRDTKRFGLVWERQEIGHESALNDDFVVLDPLPEYSVPGAAEYSADAAWSNLLIEGNNFDALRYLKLAFAGKIKCILIDPPYNTGNRDFIYNDRYVDKDDSYRHSKWLEHMYRVLTLARDLLAPDGVLFVHIGEDEVSRLGCLLDDVFPNRRVGTFIWRTRSGANDSKEYFVSTDHESILCYANPDFSFEGDVKSTDAYRNPDNDERGPWVSSDLTKAHTLSQRKDAFYPIQNPNNEIWYACDPGTVWRFASENKIKPNQKLRTETMESLIRAGKVLWPPNDEPVIYNSLEELEAAIADGTAPRNLRAGKAGDAAELAFWRAQNEFWVGKKIGKGKPRYKRHLSELKRSEKPLSTWIAPVAKRKETAQLELGDVETMESGYTTEGTSLLQEIVGHKDFPYPKPLSLVQNLIKQATQGDDIILDFFAGSGTTAHAVLNQNAQDDGNRRFILVSSSEATEKEPEKNICRDITQVRLKRVIEGYEYSTPRGRKQVAGIPGDFLYARTRRIPTGKVVRRLGHEHVWLALQLMHETKVHFRESEIYCGDGVLYLPKVNATAIDKLQKELSRRRNSGERAPIVYSWQPELLRQQLETSGDDLPDILPIPQTLVERFATR